MSVRPQDFYGEHPPERIIGTESECNVQLIPDSEIYLSDYMSDEAVEAAGYKKAGSYLDIGYKIYPDVGHFEICTPESLGPKRAAAADAAGIIVLGDIMEASGYEHGGVHRHSGTIIGAMQRTTGYHENFLIPRSLARSPLVHTVIASFLTSRFQSMAGIVAEDGFQLSQKVKGIGNPPITSSYTRRTGHGNKPMAMIPPEEGDADTIGNPKWARLEVRFADTGFSRTARFLGLAATSLALRVAEHPEIVDMTKLTDWSFNDFAAAARVFNKDLTFSAVAETTSGKYISAMDYQLALIEASAKLADKIELPADEVAALRLWQRVCDLLKQGDHSGGFDGMLLLATDFAPRYRYLRRKFTDDELHSSNFRGSPNPVEVNLSWDRILPKGGAMTYWENVPSPYVTDTDVQDALQGKSGTRAEARGRLIRKYHRTITDINWARVVTHARAYDLSNSYATTT